MQLVQRCLKGWQQHWTLQHHKLDKAFAKHHGKEYEDFLQSASAKKKSELWQQSLQETILKCEKLPQGSNKAKVITEKVIEFILLDDQPLFVVENVGFQRLVKQLEPCYQLPNHHFISDTAVPLKFKELRKFISKCLENTDTVSLTTDFSSSNVCPMSLLSLTAQWVDSSFTLQKVVLQAKQFRGSHTGESIATMLIGCLIHGKWRARSIWF